MAFKNIQPDSVTAVSSRRPQQTFRRTTLSSYHFPGPLSLSPDVLVPPGLFDPPLLPPLFLKIRQLVWMFHEKSCENVSRCSFSVSQKEIDFFSGSSSSMTSPLANIVAQPTKCRFWPKKIESTKYFCDLTCLLLIMSQQNLTTSFSEIVYILKLGLIIVES